MDCRVEPEAQGWKPENLRQLHSVRHSGPLARIPDRRHSRPPRLEPPILPWRSRTRPRGLPAPRYERGWSAPSWTLFLLRRDPDFPQRRWPRMAVEKALRG